MLAKSGGLPSVRGHVGLNEWLPVVKQLAVQSVDIIHQAIDSKPIEGS
jgi:hypothetical protein